MKSSIHLFYGIIIGILAMFCVGQRQADKKEFKEEKLYDPILGFVNSQKMKELKKNGWTIIDWEIAPDGRHCLHIGK